MPISKKKKNVVKLSSPVEMVHHRLAAFFKGDKDIIVGEIDYDSYVLDVTVTNAEKYAALSRIMETHFDFGNLHLDIDLIYERSKEEEADPLEDLETVLEGNPLFKKMEYIKSMGAEFNFCIFNKEVVQYFDDILSDPHGQRSTLAQDMAPEIFNVKNVMYCTDSED